MTACETTGHNYTSRKTKLEPVAGIMTNPEITSVYCTKCGDVVTFNEDATAKEKP